MSAYHVDVDLGGLSDGEERDAPVHGLSSEDELDEAEDGDLLLHSVHVLHEDGLAGQLRLVLSHELLILLYVAPVECVQEVIEPLALGSLQRVRDGVRKLMHRKEGRNGKAMASDVARRSSSVRTRSPKL